MLARMARQSFSNLCEGQNCGKSSTNYVLKQNDQTSNKKMKNNKNIPVNGIAACADIPFYLLDHIQIATSWRF